MFLSRSASSRCATSLQHHIWTKVDDEKVRKSLEPKTTVIVRRKVGEPGVTTPMLKLVSQEEQKEAKGEKEVENVRMPTSLS